MKKIMLAAAVAASLLTAACGDETQPVPANSANVAAPPHHDTQAQ